MKKSLLILASMLVSVASFAQWTKPDAPKGVEMAGAIEAGDTIYLYNAEAGGFFLGANDWHTRASYGPTGYKVVLKQSEEGVQIENYDEYHSAMYFVRAKNFDDIYVDCAEADISFSYWQVGGDQAGYTFSNGEVAETTTLGIAETFNGAAGNTRLFLYKESATYKAEVDGETVDYPSFSGKFYDKWILVSQKDYAEFQPKLAAYIAGVSLGSALETAKKDYPTCDFSAVEAVYNNQSSTAKDLEEAEAEITVIITDYKASLASFDQPLDMTNLIGDGSSADPWTRDFTGTGTTGSHTTNTWSTEANNGADGTDMTTPFVEHWTGSGGILSDQKIHQTVQSCAPGLYKFTADVRAYSEAGGIDEFKGLSMYFGDKSIDLQSEVDMFKSGSKCVLWSKNYFSVIAVVKETGDIDLGFEITDANFNWIAFKNTSLTYYGRENADENYIKLVSAAYGFEPYEGEDANAEVIAAYNASVSKFYDATTEEQIKEVAKEVTAAQTALEQNVAAYVAYNEEVEEIIAYMNEHNLNGEKAGIVADYIMEDNPVSPEEDEDFNGNGSYDYIKAAYNLDTDGIKAETTWIADLFSKAIAESLNPGDDCTSMMVNPGFTDDNGKGWIKAEGAGLNSNLALHGGIMPGCPVAESWHSKFDIYQIVTNVPDGVYSLSLNGFCRLDGESQVAAEVYMNEYATPLMEINEGAIPKDEAIDGFNCYLSNGDQSAAITQNPIFANNTHKSPNDATDTDTGDGYAPNGMEGASVAFSAGRYQAIAQGYVEGGTLKLGVRNLTSTGQWALWGNFKLTYLGTGADAVALMMQPIYEQLTQYIEKNSDDMTTPAVADAQAVLAAADEAKANKDEEAMSACVLSLNDALIAAKANVVAKNDYTKASDKLDEIIETYESQASAEALAAYKEVDAKRNGANELTTDEIIALTEEIDAVTTALQIPSTEGASDENPVDMTAVIKSAKFDGESTGWEGTAFALGNGCAEQYNKTYDSYQVIEGLPAGTYAVAVQGFYRQGQAANDYANMSEGGTPAYNAVIYAIGENEVECSAPIMAASEGALPSGEAKGGSTAAVGTDMVLPNSMEAANNWFEAEYYKPTDNFNTVIVKVGEDGKLTIGVKKSETLAGDWSIYDNWTLTYFGTNSSKTTGVNAIVNASTVAPAGIYTISGAKVATFQKGINIVKMADGQVKKVLVK